MRTCARAACNHQQALHTSHHTPFHLCISANGLVHTQRAAQMDAPIGSAHDEDDERAECPSMDARQGYWLGLARLGGGWG